MTFDPKVPSFPKTFFFFSALVLWVRTLARAFITDLCESGRGIFSSSDVFTSRSSFPSPHFEIGEKKAALLR